MTIGGMRELGTAVRAERKRRHLSQAELAGAAGVSREWLSRLENGAPRLEADKLLQVLSKVGIALVAPDEQPTQQDIAKAQQIAWTMSLEAQPVTEEGFQRVLRKVVAHRVRSQAA
ncbi:helix-turn-helix domain-containing protein [Kribbella sp. NPDC051770]|uniref:helix-turn-helix domain-containing protein n=1 Tax=Kribbella sp. NPDC051770 TaxID=3155413 RepID=UPI00343EC249